MRIWYKCPECFQYVDTETCPIHGEADAPITVTEHRRVYTVTHGDKILKVRQPKASDIPRVKEAVSKAGDYTRGRYPSRIWTQPEGFCYLPTFGWGGLGKLYLIMVKGWEVIGFGDHIYEHPAPAQTMFPREAVLCTQALAVIDPYQGHGWGTLYTHASNRIALDNGAHFSLGHTQKEGGMLGIRLKQGWRIYEDGEVMARIYKQIQELPSQEPIISYTADFNWHSLPKNKKQNEESE